MRAEMTGLPDAIRIKAKDDLVVPEASQGFVMTAAVEELVDRALAYLEAGYAIHLAGPAGTGKTTLAFHIAAQIGRPVTLIHGDDEFGSSDLVGKDSGYRKSRLVDNFIHSVVKTEEEMQSVWVDYRLTTACEKGHTLIYDEFNRSRPEANNALLSVLSEGILNLPKAGRSGAGYMSVSPKFRAIFTSNPEEYAGTHKTQDAMMDRLITISVGHYDADTEIAITRARSGIDPVDAAIIVEIVRTVRGVGVNNHRPTIRACIAIARVLAGRGGRATLEDPLFVKVCRDVLNVNTAKVTRGGQSVMPEMVEEALRTVCGRVALEESAARPPVVPPGLVETEGRDHGDSAEGNAQPEDPVGPRGRPKRAVPSVHGDKRPRDGKGAAGAGTRVRTRARRNN